MKNFDEQLDDAIAHANLISESNKPKEPTPLTIDKSEAEFADPLKTLAEFKDNITWFNSSARWMRNAFRRVASAGNKAVDVSLYMWDHAWDYGLGQTCRVAAKASSKIATAYGKMFNYFSYNQEPGSKKEFSKVRASLFIAATLALPFGAYYGTMPLVVRPAYDVAMKTTTERQERIYLYNAEPIPGNPYMWSVSASATKQRDDASAQKMLIRRNIAYLRLAKSTEMLASTIAEEPELFNVTLTGHRFRLPGGLIDLYPEIQKLDQNIPPTPAPEAHP